jgi:hypothetical protein
VQVWRSDAPMRSRLAERGGAGDGGAFSLVRSTHPKSYVARSLDPSWLPSPKDQPKYRERSGNGDNLDEKGIRVLDGHVVVNGASGAAVVDPTFRTTRCRQECAPFLASRRRLNPNSCSGEWRFTLTDRY